MGENLSLMQKINGKKTISAFNHASTLLQMQEDAIEGVMGNQNAINKIKKILI